MTNLFRSVLLLLPLCLLGQTKELNNIPVECHKQPDAPDLVGKKISRKYDALWCVTTNLTDRGWTLTRVMLAQSLGKEGVSVVKDGFATADFNRSTGKFLKIAKVVTRGGAIVGMTAVPSLGIWGGLIGWVAGRQGSEELDEFANSAAKLAPQLEEIVGALGSDIVPVEPYDTVGLMVLTTDLGAANTVVHGTLQVYVDVPPMLNVRPITSDANETFLPLIGETQYNILHFPGDIESITELKNYVLPLRGSRIYNR